MGYDNRRSLIAVTVANGETVSSSVRLGQMAVVGVKLPASFTTADITWENCHIDTAAEPDTANFIAVYKQDGTTKAGKITGAVQGREYVIEGLAEVATLSRARMKLSAANATGGTVTAWLIVRELS